MEHLHGDLEVVVGERDDVGVGPVTEHDGLLLERLAKRSEIVAQPGCGLEVEFVGGRLHLQFDFADQLVGAAGEEVAERFDDVAVFVGVDPADARGRALVDVAEQAGPADLGVSFEHPGRAGAGGKDAQQQVECFADRPRVRVRARSTGRPCGADRGRRTGAGYSSLRVTASMGYVLSSR